MAKQKSKKKTKKPETSVEPEKQVEPSTQEVKTSTTDAKPSRRFNPVILVITFIVIVILLLLFVGKLLTNNSSNNSTNTTTNTNSSTNSLPVSQPNQSSSPCSSCNSSNSSSSSNLPNVTQNQPSSNASVSSMSTTATGHSIDGYQRSLANQQAIETSGVWQPTQYNAGDITANTYTVQRGDTLWQIAKAYYGSGTEWHKILNSNSSQIGFLPDGEQALIRPGQVLTLP